MKKTLLLAAALACSGVAQAETWVCAGLHSEFHSENVQTIFTFDRKEDYFAVKVSTQGEEDIEVNQEILAEDENLLIIGEFRLDELSGASLRMINKKTNEFVEDSVFMSKKYASVRQEGSCTKI